MEQLQRSLDFMEQGKRGRAYTLYIVYRLLPEQVFHSDFK